jgi:hypothetical protein
VIIDQHHLAIGVILGMSGQVDLPHMARWKRLQIGHRISPHVSTTHIDIIDVAQ